MCNACPIRLDDLREIRKTLGLSQAGMARALDVSLRAVQSYEQGWRKAPINVLRMAWLILFCHWRKTLGPQKPCWEVNRCDEQTRQECFAYSHHSGDLCWIMGGTECKKLAGVDCMERISHCRQCPVLLQYIAS